MKAKFSFTDPALYDVLQYYDTVFLCSIFVFLF